MTKTPGLLIGLALTGIYAYNVHDELTWQGVLLGLFLALDVRDIKKYLADLRG
jgi:hypothetical protein